jgi:hypothetical protein
MTKNVAKGKGAKPSSRETKNVVSFKRIWSMQDEVHIMEVMVVYLCEHDTLPLPPCMTANFTTVTTVWCR